MPLSLTCVVLFLVCLSYRSMDRKKCFLACPPSGNMARKQCFLVGNYVLLVNILETQLGGKQCTNFLSIADGLCGISFGWRTNT